MGRKKLAKELLFEVTKFDKLKKEYKKPLNKGKKSPLRLVRLI